MASTSRFTSSEVASQDAATRKAKEVAAMLSASLGVPQTSTESSKNTMMIPSDKVGMVIGKAGARIREIENFAGVRLQLDSTGEPLRKIWIMGKDESVALAKSKIQEILNLSKSGGRGSQNPTKIVPIPSEQVGLLIGAGGSTIKRFSQEHSCHLKVVSEEEALRTNQQIPQKGYQNLHIMGTAEAAANAERAVLSFLGRGVTGTVSAIAGYGVYQPQIFQQRVQPYATFAPQNYGAIMQAYTNVGQPYVNTNYAYAPPGHIYPPQGFTAQSLAGFQPYTPIAPQYASTTDSSKSGQADYVPAQDVPQNVVINQPNPGNPFINGPSSLTFGSPIQNIQPQPAGAIPGNPSLPSVENPQVDKGSSNASSQSVGLQPGVPLMQQVNYPPTPVLNYPIQNYSTTAVIQGSILPQSGQQHIVYDPVNPGGSFTLQNQTTGAEIQKQNGSLSNIIPPTNSQELSGSDAKSSGSSQLSTENNNAVSHQGSGGSIQILTCNKTIEANDREGHNVTQKGVTLDNKAQI